MSDLCMYELDDNIWDEFGENDDRRVPHSAYEYGDQFIVLANSRKKPRHEAMGSDTNNTNSHIYLTREGGMLEKGPWLQTTNGGSPASCDVGSGKDVRNISENSKISGHGFDSSHIDAVDDDFCTAGPLLGDSSTAAHDSLYNYSLNHIPQTENNLSFFDSECNDQESNDLFYGWTDIGNFEDVDKMFRSCDSTFGMGSLNNGDNVYWFSNSQPTEESEAAMTDDSKPSKILENKGASRLKNEDSLTNEESNQKHVVKDDSQSTVVEDSALGNLSVDVSDTHLQEEDVLILDEQANVNKKQAKRLHHLDGKRNRFSENGVSFHQSDKSKQIIDTKHEYGHSNCQYHAPSAFQQPGVRYSHLNYDQPSDQMSACQTSSGVKSENNPNPSSASNESYASNQAQSLESLHGPTVDAPCMMGFEKRGKLQQGQDMHPSFATTVRNGNKPSVVVLSESVPVQKIEGENEARQAEDAPAELDSSNVQESSCVSSVMDDISLEATSFRQLQQVIEQLDIRTKLCIRDSLYRLAKSAEQRHNCVNPNSGTRHEKDAGLQPSTSDTNKYAGFLDMETDTNPIDRSIAHLLFHRPSDSALVSDNDVLSYKSHPMIPQPNSSPSLRIEKQEETSVARTEVVASDEK